MKQYLHIWILSTLYALLSTASSLHGQILIHKNLNVEDGLVYSQVLCAYQDHDGYMWFGTSSGISRWDGLQFENFHSTEKIRFDNVKLITESKIGNLVIVTRHGVLNYKEGVFSPLENQPSELENWIEQAVKLNDGLIYLADQDSCLWQFDGQYFKEVSPKGCPVGMKILSLGMAPNRTLLMGTKNNGLISMRAKKINKDYIPPAHQPANISWIHTSSNGNIYLATKGSGLYIYDGHSMNQISSSDGLPGRVINHFWESEKGIVYIATDEGVALLSEGKIVKTISVENGLANSFVWYITADHQGNIYFCTDGGGVSQYQPGVYRTYNTKTGLPDNTVWCIRETNPAEYYFATDNGVAVLKDDKIHTITTDQGLSDNMVITIQSSDDGTLFLGTSDHGVDIFRNDKFENLNQSNGLTSNSVWSITKDSENRFYLGTYDGGICVYQGGQIIDTINTRDGLANDYIVSAYTSPDGINYFGLDNGGVFAVENGRLNTKKIYLPGLTVWSIHQNGSGNLYFGTDKNGLIYFTPSGRDTLTIADGLSNNCILGIMEGKQGLLYLTTDNGVNIVDLSKKPAKIRLITNDDGLASRECNQGAYFKDSRERLWIGTIRGVTCYDPSLDSPIISDLPTHITGMSVFDWKIPLTTNHISKPFKYHENYIKFNFIGIDLKSANKVHYRYRMNNSDSEWIGTDYPQVQFANLEDDTYHFEVQSSNDWGVWGETAHVTFSILPPFWSTWWFRTLIILIVVGVTAMLIYFRIRQLLAVERIRAKIAADLHDDIGAGLSEINILTAVAEAKTPVEVKEHTKNELARIGKTAGQLIDSMSDIVWLVNPKKDSMTDLVTRLKDIFNDLLDAKGITFNNENMHLLTKIRLNMEHRQFIFLIFKEALNNALKYSNCTVVDFKVLTEKSRLKIILADNGTGFDLDNHKDGNGLKNMRERANKINGNLDIESRPGKGTKLIFTGKI